MVYSTQTLCKIVAISCWPTVPHMSLDIQAIKTQGMLTRCGNQCLDSDPHSQNHGWGTTANVRSHPVEHRAHTWNSIERLNSEHHGKMLLLLLLLFLLLLLLFYCCCCNCCNCCCGGAGRIMLFYIHSVIFCVLHQAPPVSRLVAPGCLAHKHQMRWAWQAMRDPLEIMKKTLAFNWVFWQYLGEAFLAS